MKYCSECGEHLQPLAIPIDQFQFPFQCLNCGKVHFKNPIPVVVCLFRASDLNRNSGVLLVRRATGRMAGKWALPGGFMDFSDESWQHAASREVREETGLEIPHESWKPFDLQMSSDHNLLVFVSTDYVPPLTTDRHDNPETDGLRVTQAAEELAFPAHTNALKLYLTSVLEFRRI